MGVQGVCRVSVTESRSAEGGDAFAKGCTGGVQGVGYRLARMTLPLYPHGHRAAGPGGPATRKPRGLVAPEDVVELTLLPLETLTSLPWTLTPTEAGLFSGALRQYSAEMV